MAWRDSLLDPSRPVTAQRSSKTLLIASDAAILAGEFPMDEWLRQEPLPSDSASAARPFARGLVGPSLRRCGVRSSRRGALVRGPTTTEIREAYAIRAELEGFGAQLAATRARESDLQVLANAAKVFASVAEGLLEAPAEKSIAQQGGLDPRQRPVPQRCAGGFREQPAAARGRRASARALRETSLGRHWLTRPHSSRTT